MFIFMCIGVCLYVCMYVYMREPGTRGGQKRLLDLLALELQMVIKPPCGFLEWNLSPLQKR